MLRPVFEIIPEAIFFHETNLICEISINSFSYVFENDIEKKFDGLSVFYFKSGDKIEQQLKQIFNEQPLLHKKYKKVFVSYTFGQSTLLPEEMYNPEENDLLLNTIFGDVDSGIILTDVIADKKIYNVYRISRDIHQMIVDQFHFAAFNHHHSLLIKQKISEDVLKVIFYKDSFIAHLVKNSDLQLINSYSYKSGIDIVYHLQNICRAYNMNSVQISMGGMIDTNSDLHKEMEHYFKNIKFTQLPPEYKYTDNLLQMPPHYFSHLYSIALCV